MAGSVSSGRLDRVPSDDDRMPALASGVNDDPERDDEESQEGGGDQDEYFHFECLLTDYGRLVFGAPAWMRCISQVGAPD